jgi:HEAT repeat protein
LSSLGAEDIARVRPQLDAWLAGDEADRAQMAFEVLERTEQPLDLDALMQSKHESVRDLAFWRALDRGQLSTEAAIRAIPRGLGNDRIAQYLGSRVAVEAVPALIGLLKDPIEGVRTSASEALNKIRFHHEQQTYWDRIVKGLDASPASAAEKLLLQGKPGAPKDQRLLAITSLGTLGVPEALPFLIEWTQDTDAAISKAAKDAITQNHLNPRK